MKTNVNSQRFAACNLSFKKIMTSLAIASIATLSTIQSSAQPFGSNCTTTSIDISTGIDHTGAIIPYPTSGSTPDPYWTVTMVPTNTISLTAPYCAELVDNTNATNASTLGGHVQSGSAYISFATTPTVANLGGTSGMFWTYHHNVLGGGPGPLGGATPTRFTREFYIEGASSQSVDIDITGFGDDIIFIAVDQAVGTPIFTTPSSPNLVYYNATTPTTTTTMTASVTLTLSPGAHTLDVELYDISGVISATSLNGTISCTNQVLAKNECYGQNACGTVTYEPCDDECYWTVDGNNIHNGRNKFGTLSDDNINIVANGDYRGIITSGAPGVGNSFLGWNTMNPTSILHVDCMGNHDDGSGMSDIRFENLEHGLGNILVIDDQGHVFRTDYYIEDIIRGADAGQKMADADQKYDELKAQYDKLQQNFNSLSARLDALQNCCSNNGSYSDVNTMNTDNILYQNSPNPFGSETTIEYYIHDMKANAFIAVYDLNGRELSRYMIDAKGKGSVVVKSDKMESGMYVYALVIDGQEVATKKMVFTKH